MLPIMGEKVSWKELCVSMSKRIEATLVLVDNNSDELFLTKHHVRRDGIINECISA